MTKTKKKKKKKPKIKLVVNIWHDDTAESPNDWYGWTAHSFGRHHANRIDPDDIGFEENEEGYRKPNEALQAKLDAGLAFFLDYYEHGLCQWSLSGEGPSCRWDSVSVAGIVVWDEDEDGIGAKTREDREKDARNFMESFTSWCNGHVYGFNVEAFKVCPTCGHDEEVDEEEADGPDFSHCGNFIIDGDDAALDSMIEAIKENIGDDWDSYEVKFKEQNGFGIADEIKRRWKGE